MGYIGSKPANTALGPEQLSFDVATQAELDVVEGAKADQATTYTKTEVDTAVGTKQDTLVSGTNIKAINGQSLVGSGDLAVGLGEGQTWQDVTASRSAGVTYTNTAGKPIMVNVIGDYGGSGTTAVDFYVDSSFVNRSGIVASQSAGTRVSVTAIVPDGSTYKIESFSTTSIGWHELR